MKEKKKRQSLYLLDGEILVKVCLSLDKTGKACSMHNY